MDPFDDQNSILGSLYYDPTRFRDNLYNIDSEQDPFYIRQVLSNLNQSALINPIHYQNNIAMVVQEQEQTIIKSGWSTISNLPSQSESYDNISEKPQIIQEMSLPEEELHTSYEQKLNQYSLGHIDSLNNSQWPIFGSSRKYQRSKKVKGSKKVTEFEAMAKRMRVFKGKHLNTTYAKRFDQQQNKKFRKQLPKEQDRKDITPSSLRNIIKNHKNGDNSKVLSSFIEKCESQRHWYVFLNMWNSERKMNWEKELNC